jgi:hypothetical protein
VIRKKKKNVEGQPVFFRYPTSTLHIKNLTTSFLNETLQSFDSIFTDSYSTIFRKKEQLKIKYQ